MKNDLETLRKLWPYLTDACRETVVQFATSTALANGYEEPSPTVFKAEDRATRKRELLGVDWRSQRRAMEIEQELLGPEDCPF